MESNTESSLIDLEESKLKEIFDAKTEDILRELNLNIETLDSFDFSVVDYINQMFPNEQSLAGIDDIMEGIEIRIKELDEETRKILRDQWKTESSGQIAVQEATSMIQDLFSKIREVQTQATHSENMVKEITQDIQQLDLAKKNLTVSITTLNNMTLLMSSVDKLKSILSLTGKSQEPTNPFETVKSGDDTELSVDYRQIDDHLAHSTKILSQLKIQFPNIPVVRDLNIDMNQIISELSKGQLQTDIRQVVMSGKVNINNQALVDQLHAMCRIIDQLDPSNRKSLIKWFIDHQLSEYRVLFDETQTTAWLDKIDHRYSWLRSNLLNFDTRFNLYFPKSWLMIERLILEFCEYTKNALIGLMKQRSSELNDSLVIFAIQRTKVFEDILKKSFCADQLKQLIINTKLQNVEKEDLGVNNPFIESDENKNETYDNAAAIEDETNEENPVDGIISSCFEPHLHLYITDVNRVLNEQLKNHLINDFTVNEPSINDKEFEEVLGDVKNDPNNSISNSGVQNNTDSAENSLNSATNLFLLYRKVLTQAPQLSRGMPLVELSKVLGKHLCNYNTKVLLTQLPHVKRVGGLAGIIAGSTSTESANLENVNTAGSGSGSVGGSAVSGTYIASNTVSVVITANQIIQSLLKNDQTVRLSKEDVKKVCVILVTSCYCLKTVEELEKILKSKVNPRDLAPLIDMSGEIEQFRGTRASCVQLLAAELESACEPALTAMVKMNWAAVEAVGDQSNYVSAIVSHLRETVPLVRHYLWNVRAFFTQFCIQFVNGFISRFLNALFRCRLPNTVAAEQLLLDTHSLKSVLMKLPILDSKIHLDPPRSFTTVVLQGMGRAEKIIKVVMTPSSRTSSELVESVLHLLPDCDSAELQRILDMKGVRRPDQNNILEIFRREQNLAVSSDKQDKNEKKDSQSTSLNNISDSIMSSDTPSNRMTQLERLMKIIK